MKSMVYEIENAKTREKHLFSPFFMQLYTRIIRKLDYADELGIILMDETTK